MQDLLAEATTFLKKMQCRNDGFNLAKSLVIVSSQLAWNSSLTGQSLHFFPPKLANEQYRVASSLCTS